jgi:ribosomal protein S18 acetylase RimI-like enzyme
VSERHAALREAFTNLSLLSAAGRAARHGQDLVVPTSSTLSAANECGLGMLAYMVIREATAEDWPAIWPILREVGTAGETLTWDSARTEARARSGWMREPPGRTIVAVDDGGSVIGSANTYPIHRGPGAHIANAGFVVQPARRGEGAGRALCRHVLEQARADGYRAMQFNAVVETNTPAIRLWRSFGFQILATVPEAFRHPLHGYVGLHIMYKPL